MAMAAAISIEHPHSAHNRTKEWESCCTEIFMGRDPKLQRHATTDETSVEISSDDDGEDNEDSLFFGCSSAPGCLAINMIEDESGQSDTQHPNFDSWMMAALALHASIDEVSSMIQRKAASYVSSADTLGICFDGEDGGAGAAHMTDSDRSILETTVAGFAAGMAKQIDSLRRAAAAEGGRPFPRAADGDAAAPPRRRASGPVAHRAGIAACLMERLRLEIMDPMTRLQSRRETSTSEKGAGDDAAAIARNPLRAFRSAADEAARRPPPPAPWEAGGHDAGRDRAEREEEEREFLDVYFGDGGEAPGDVSSEEVARDIVPPAPVTRLMDLPAPTRKHRQQLLEQHQPTPVQQAPRQTMHEEEDHIDQLQQESATLLATYQHSDLEGIQKAEMSMVQITQLLGRFTDLITEQQEDVFMIHDQALKSKENVDKGQDQLVDAANRGEKSKHPMATFIMVMAILLLLFNWITP